MPDINTIPTTRALSMSIPPNSPLSHRPRRISIGTGDAARPSPPSPRSPSLSSLQAAATINAGLHRSPSRASPSLERRRSSLMNNLSLNDPTVPAPGELQQANGSNSGSPRMSRRSFAMPTADPNHHRQPSLGELHQELESEQEAQVNRLLGLIRAQQDQLAALARAQNDSSPASTESQSIATPTSTNITEPSPRSNSISAAHQHYNRPHSLSRRSSVLVSTPGSRGTSPALRPQSGSLGPLSEDFLLGGARDENAFYQAEAQNLTRENQMLKLRIRELERQVADMASAVPGSPQPASNQVHLHSPLGSPPTTSTGQANPAPAVAAEAGAKTE